MSIITLSRVAGSLGDETARLLAESMQYRLMDRSAMEKTIDGEGFPDIPLDRFDEHSPSFWENFTTGKDVYLDRLRTSMLESATGGKAVFLGRGSQFIMNGIPGTFRVRLIASHDVRVARLTEILGCDVKTAERYCRKSDHDRHGFSRFFFGGHWTDPATYDMTLCTDNLDSRTAADIVRDAYKASPASKTDGGKILRNRLTAQIVRNRILYVERVPVDLLEVEAEDGHVTIRGTVTVRENADRCETAARNIEAVTSVDAEVYFVNPVMTY
ncbi:MAG: cytidylate kinase family protein [Spirochaetaceae bacterium]|nr:cytidylate kinase family protein [Spirochaetaceae bacterium]